MSPNAESVYKMTLLLIVALLFVATWLDILLYRSGQETITSWLRKHPGWIIYTVAAAAVYLLLLLLHLFGPDA